MTDKHTKVRIAPNSHESEMMVLGCMLTNVNSLNIAAHSLEEEDFYYTEHKTVFFVLKSFYQSNKSTDTHLVCEELKRVDKLGKIGGVSYIISLAQYAGTSAYVEEYVDLIKDKSYLRKMINFGEYITESALNEPADVKDALDDAQGKLFAISQRSDNTEGLSIKDYMDGTISESGLSYIEELQKRQEAYIELGEDALKFTGIPTGFIDLDKMINGLAQSNLIILASRPSMGKTALAMNIAENICFKSKVPVGVFSLEMSAKEIIDRIVCSKTEVESEKIKNGTVTGIEFQKIFSECKIMIEHKMVIEDQPGISITDLVARARRMVQTCGVEFIVIDYLQLLSGSSKRYGHENRQQEISEISRKLKNLARELKIPILCLSQLSRKVEDRPDKRPMMSDLRESGAIEQDADLVMFIFRREYYNPEDKPGLAELIVGKNRHGEVGCVNLAFCKPFAKFTNISYAKEEECSDGFKDFDSHLKY